eukprot:541955_1
MNQARKARSQRRLKRKNQSDWNWKQDTHKAVHRSICLIVPHSVQLSPNKNQTVVGKKELAKLRKKADQFSQLLTKAKALKEKNKDLRDEMIKLNSRKREKDELETKCNELETQCNELKFDLDEVNERVE